LGHQNAGILQRISLRDPSAFQDCIDHYGAIVWRMARRLTRSNADAEDATQEVFLTIWQNAARFDPNLGSEGGFVVLLARRRLVDGLRRQYARPATESLTAHTGETLDFASYPSTADESFDGARALEALHRLDPGYRQVLLLAVLQGLTQSEIATRLKMPLGTVKSSVRRGLMLIRTALLEPSKRERSTGYGAFSVRSAEAVYPGRKRFGSIAAPAVELS
jgi:RNA polymerase sigma factor (sigma-70 family)